MAKSKGLGGWVNGHCRCEVRAEVRPGGLDRRMLEVIIGGCMLEGLATTSETLPSSFWNDENTLTPRLARACASNDLARRP